MVQHRQTNTQYSALKGTARFYKIIIYEFNSILSLFLVYKREEGIVLFEAKYRMLLRWKGLLSAIWVCLICLSKARSH